MSCFCICKTKSKCCKSFCPPEGEQVSLTSCFNFGCCFKKSSKTKTVRNYDNHSNQKKKNKVTNNYYSDDDDDVYETRV